MEPLSQAGEEPPGRIGEQYYLHTKGRGPTTVAEDLEKFYLGGDM